MTTDKLTTVIVSTEVGDFTVGVDEKSAPISGANFLAYVDGGHLDGSSVYRIVTLGNQPADTPCKIEVIQWGWRLADGAYASAFAPIPHEPTSQTGLRHLDGTLSMARREPGTAGSAFFICIGDQPELDEGGRRNPDRAGFAAFGKVLEGRDVVQRIFTHAEDVERLRNPVAIRSVRRSGRSR